MSARCISNTSSSLSRTSCMVSLLESPPRASRMSPHLEQTADISYWKVFRTGLCSMAVLPQELWVRPSPVTRDRRPAGPSGGMCTDECIIDPGSKLPGTFRKLPSFGPAAWRRPRHRRVGQELCVLHWWVQKDTQALPGPTVPSTPCGKSEASFSEPIFEMRR